jgi:competence protein ComEC
MLRAAGAWLDAERDQLILWLPVCMAAGVLLCFGARTEPPLWAGAAAAAAAFAIAVCFDRPLTRGIALALGFAALGFASAQWAIARAPPLETDLPFHAVPLTGTIAAVEALPNGRRILLSHVDLGDRTLRRMVRIRLKTGDPTPLAAGDRVRVRAIARPPPPPAYPGAWDTRFEAFFADIGAYGTALDRVERLTEGPGSPFQTARETIAAHVTAAIPGAAGAVAVTLLTGAARGIPEADHEAFRQSGLAHLLAVAGLHLGIVMGCALLLTRTMLALSEHATLFWPAKRIAALAALAAGFAYLQLTGAHVPIIRGFSMACLYTLAAVLGRQPVPMRALALAAIVLMTIEPWQVPGVSFQMSFSAVIALIAGYEALWPRLPARLRRGWRGHAIALSLTSLLAGTASMPYGAWHFGHVQTWYVPSNMIAVPVTAFWVMPLGLLGLALMPLGLDRLALVPMGWGTDLLIRIARFFADLPWSQPSVPHMPGWGLAILSLGIVWAGIWRTRVRYWGFAAILGGILSAALDRPPDILVSADGGMIGVRTADGVLLGQTRAAAFTRDAWLTRWSVATARPLPWSSCGDPACRIVPRPGTRAALILRGGVHAVSCDGVAAAVSAEPARGVCHGPGVRLVDRFTVWREGAAAIWLTPEGAVVQTDRGTVGQRRWIPPPPVPRAAPVPALPLAPLDEPPVSTAAAARPGVPEP